MISSSLSTATELVHPAVKVPSPATTSKYPSVPEAKKFLVFPPDTFHPEPARVLTSPPFPVSAAPTTPINEGSCTVLFPPTHGNCSSQRILKASQEGACILVKGRFINEVMISAATKALLAEKILSPLGTKSKPLTV